MKFCKDKHHNIVDKWLKFDYCKVNSFWVIREKLKIIGMRALQSTKTKLIIKVVSFKLSS